MKMWFNFNKTPEIEFYTAPQLIDVIPSPDVAGKFLPDWYKKLSKYYTGRTDNDEDIDEKVKNRKLNQTVKWCIPFRDAMSTGYIIPAWADITIQVDRDPETNQLRARQFLGDQFEPTLNSHPWVQLGDEATLKIDKPVKSILKLESPWFIRTPIGYSIRVSNPPNGFHSNLHLFEGIIDTDAYNLRINFPLLWMGREEGMFTIRHGTPIGHVQMFKREKQKIVVRETRKEEEKKLEAQKYLLQYTNLNKYRRWFWHKSKERKVIR